MVYIHSKAWFQTLSFFPKNIYEIIFNQFSGNFCFVKIVKQKSNYDFDEQQQFARVDEWNPQAHRTTTRACREADGRNKNVSVFSYLPFAYLKSMEHMHKSRMVRTAKPTSTQLHNRQDTQREERKGKERKKPTQTDWAFSFCHCY